MYSHFKGYGDDENTWEPKENLDCEDLIKAFEDKRKAEQAKKKVMGGTKKTLPDTSMPPPAPRSPWSHEPIVSSVSTGPTMTATPAPLPTTLDAASVCVFSNKIRILRHPHL